MGQGASCILQVILENDYDRISPMPLQNCRANINNYIIIYTTTHCNSSTD
jgi:hypothetical protein